MNPKLKPLFILVLINLGVPVWLMGQTPVFEEAVCLNELYSEYTNAEYRAHKSDGYCSSGTKIRLLLTDDNGIVDLIGPERLNIDDNGHRVKVMIKWKKGKTGTVSVDVQYQTMNWDGLVSCDFAGWRDLYTYKIHRGELNPGGSLHGTDLYETNGSEQVDFQLTYEKSEAYPFDVNRVRYRVNGQSLTDAVKHSGSGSSFSLRYTALNIGEYTFTTEVYNECEEWIPGPSKTVSIKPTCWTDDPSGTGLILNGLFLAGDGNASLEKEKKYTISPVGILDFDSHYELEHDGGKDISLSGNSFTVHSGLGSYRITAVPKVGRDVCAEIPPLKVFVGGKDEVFQQPCMISLPQDLKSFGYELTPDEPALQHFAATVRSEKGFVIKPGITLSMGAELILDYEEPEIDESEKNPDMNFIQATSYDEYGRVAGQSRLYFDTQGRPIQSQYKDLENDVLMASQTIYDAYGRAVINTLVAPVGAGDYKEVIDNCGDQVPRGAKVPFAYKGDFVTGPDGQPYNYTHFDLDKELNPDPVANANEGTLGWYYSSNNGTSADENINEPQIAITGYPYSRILFHQDGSGEVRTSTSPEEAFKAGSEHLGESNLESISNSDEYLTDYLNIRRSELGLKNAAGLLYEGNFFKSISIDAHKKKMVTYQDLNGNGIISLYFGNQLTPVTRSYQFYNDRGQLVVSLTPNGWQKYKEKGSFTEVDKTTYTYDAKGRMIAMDEADAGHSEYVYRKDGSIRFSQNEEQAEKGSFSYTNYDRSGRPVESGEYMPGAVSFKSSQMEALLEHYGEDGDLPEDSGTKSNQIYTFYDLQDPELPVNREQRFVQGTVSFSKKENTVTTWYSYDEQGRVEWVVQQIEGLGMKTLDYRYSPTGAVQEVAYQKGTPEEDYYHYYEYDADSRLVKAYTATEEILYNQFGELTNRGVLEEQAAYDYYLHGPLKRVELARNLQGIDYIYTANGTLKSINHADIQLDPGQDGEGNGFREDAFGMTLDYYQNDYEGADYNAGAVSISGAPEQFSGNIRAQSWHSPVDGGERRTYAYQYDERYQLTGAEWGNHSGKSGSGSYSFAMDHGKAFQENIPAYDLNGNISQLNRIGEYGNNIAGFSYHYTSNTNQLEEVKSGGVTFREYKYNHIGQMVSQAESGKEQIHIEYDLTGKVVGVYKSFNAASGQYSQPIATFTYDDRGFRLSKTIYDETGNEHLKNWYVRDASGTLLSTYIQKGAEVAEQEELPIYGAGKIGVYRPNAVVNKHMYELSDHLGNVRAVVGEPVTVEYLATMESEVPEVEGKENFHGIDPVVTAAFINHTPSVVTLNGIEHFVPEPHQVIRINNAKDNPKKVIGGSIMLPVSSGDEINAEVFAKYINFEKGNTNILPGLASYLGTAFGMPAGGDGISSIFNIVEAPGSLAYSALGGASEDNPRIFLNYILFDRNFELQDFGLAQVSDAAEIPETNAELHPHELLELEVKVKKGGYIYIYVSNDDGQNMDAYFDDFRITHQYGDIVAGSDYYPYGLVMASREINREKYRYGYQGQFAEKDSVNEWNHFNLRQYDPVVGRWNRTDPAGQYWSPYLAMGNNPVSMVDPDGAFSRFGAWWRNGVYGGQGTLQDFTGEWGYLNPSWITNDGSSLSTMLVDLTTTDELSGVKGLQAGLDVVGLIPLFGEAADGINAGIYAIQGDWGNASLSAAAMIPIGGQAATGVKLTKRAHTVYTGVKGGKKYVGITADLNKRYSAAQRAEMGITPLLENIPGRNLARGIEQQLINHHRLDNLSNIYNSIDPVKQLRKHSSTMQNAANYLDTYLPGWNK